MAARESYYVESLTEQTTTLASAQDALTYAFTPSAGKSYFVIATAELLTTSTSVKVKANFSNTTDAVVHNSVIAGAGNASNYISFSGMTKYTDGGSATTKTFKIQYQAGTAATTVKIKNCRILIIEVGANDQYFESLGSSATNSAAINKINSSFTPGSTGDYTLLWCADVTVSTTTSRAQTSVLVGATTYDQNSRQPRTTSDIYTQCGVIGLATLANSSQTVRMVANVSSAVAGTIANAKMIFLRHDGFDDAHFVYQGTSQARSATTYGDVTGAALTFTPAADNYILLAGCLQWGGSTSALVGTQLIDDASTIYAETLQAGDTTTERNNFIMASLITPTNASHTYKFQFKASISSANFQYGTVSALKVGTVNANPSPTPAGVQGTGAAGSAIAEQDVAPSGVQATGAAGAPTPQVQVTGSGVSATGSAGTPTVAIITSATASPTGVQGTGSAGSATPQDTITQTGVQGTGASGSIVPQETVNPTGVSATGSAGTPTLTISASISPTGVQATGAAGSVAPGEAGTSTGVAATGNVGVTVESNAKSASGVSGTGAAGSSNIALIIFLSGVQGVGAVGIVTVTTSGNANASPSGVQGTGFAGSVSITIVNPASGGVYDWIIPKRRGRR